jgi:molybdate transport system regulatory protein
MAKKTSGTRTLKKNKLHFNGRIWIDMGKKAFLGYGRIELLEHIQRTGSISKAAAEMKMSYRQAWELIEDMNHTSAEPLVVSQRGGKGGGFALLTPIAREYIKLFKKFNKDFQKFLKSYH